MAEISRLDAAGIPVFFAESYRPFAESLSAAVEETASFLGDRWNLRPPAECQVRVLTDVFDFVAATVPRRVRPLVALSRPLWRRRAARSFEIAGGWMLPWPGRVAVGVKPPELLASAKTALGERLFEPVSDMTEKARHITCHELTHAFSAHLRLPAWLNEGLAMRAVDHVVGYPTVREASLSRVARDLEALDSRAYRRVRPSDHEALLTLYATGYWITRRIEDQAPATLRELLQYRRPPAEVNRVVSNALGL